MPYTKPILLKVTDAASLRNVGEACFFRAYSYFELVKTYGDVPLINFKIKNPTDGIKDKSPAATIYTFIDSNLQVAAKYLPIDASGYGNNAYKGRLTRGAANTLMGANIFIQAKLEQGSQSYVTR